MQTLLGFLGLAKKTPFTTPTSTPATSNATAFTSQNPQFGKISANQYRNTLASRLVKNYKSKNQTALNANLKDLKNYVGLFPNGKNFVAKRFSRTESDISSLSAEEEKGLRNLLNTRVLNSPFGHVPFGNINQLGGTTRKNRKSTTRKSKNRKTTRRN